MTEIRKLKDGKWYRLVSQPLHETLIAYMVRAGYGDQFHDEYDNPEEVWEECHD